MSVQEKLAAGGMLSLAREFCPLVGISPGTAYKAVKEGHLRITKIGGRTAVAAADAKAYLDYLRDLGRPAA